MFAVMKTYWDLMNESPLLHGLTTPRRLLLVMNLGDRLMRDLTEDILAFRADRQHRIM